MGGKSKGVGGKSKGVGGKSPPGPATCSAAGQVWWTAVPSTKLRAAVGLGSSRPLGPGLGLGLWLWLWLWVGLGSGSGLGLVPWAWGRAGPSDLG